MASTTITFVGTIQAIITEAQQAARVAATERLNKKLSIHGRATGPCGFAWVELHAHNGKKIDGRSKMGKLLKQAGVKKSDNKGFYIWNPSGSMEQAVDILEAGAHAAADLLRSFGFTAYVECALD
jgi:hypothetical protein